MRDRVVASRMPATQSRTQAARGSSAAAAARNPGPAAQARPSGLYQLGCEAALDRGWASSDHHCTKVTRACSRFELVAAHAPAHLGASRSLRVQELIKTDRRTTRQLVDSKTDSFVATFGVDANSDEKA